ncbi:MAG: hypothetical protein LBC07_03365 [Elusimicrobiota bacterium]|nr:hypothetical protein [Elusimicrobiota bacterium]
MGAASSLSFIYSNVKFSSNTASAQKGAAVGMRGSNKLYFVNSNVEFSSNVSLRYGGALNLEDNSNIFFTFSSVSFLNNKSLTHYGGVAGVDNSTITFVNSYIYFSGNTDLSGANDISFYTANSALIFAGANTLANGLQSNAYNGSAYIYTATVQKTDVGILAVEGAPLFIKNNFVVQGGTVAIKTPGVSLAINLNVSGNSALFLQNNGFDTFISSAIAFTNSYLILDVNFKTGEGDLLKIEGTAASAGTFTVSNSTLQVNSLAGFGPDPVAIVTAKSITGGDQLFVLGGFRLELDGTTRILLWGGSVWDIFAAGFQSAQENATVSLSQNAKSLDSQDPIPLGSPANKNITVAGGGNTLDSAPTAALGFALSQTSVTFKSIGFINFTTATYGSVMFSVKSTLTFFANVNFSNNIAVSVPTSAGGALYLQDSDIYFINSTVTFFQNSAQGAGGAIAAAGAARIVFSASSVNFISNRANDSTNGRGGAIGNYGDKNINYIFQYSTINFLGNYAGASGGAFYTDDSTATFFNSYIVFSLNKADSYGGALGGYRSSYNFVNSKVYFTSNTAQMGGGAINVDAGGVYNFINSQVYFSSNTALSADIGDGGGAVRFYINGGAFGIIKSTVVFAYNTTLSGGGAIKSPANSKIYISNSSVSFISNKASADGGAVYANGGVYVFENSKAQFFGNAANTGAAFYAADSTAAFSNSYIVFSLNKAGGSGGAFGGSRSSYNFINSNVYFSSNTAQLAGGALSAGGGIAYNFINSNIYFTNNSALGSGGGEGGGAVYFYNEAPSNTPSVMSVINSTALFAYNSASEMGGAIKSGSNAKFYISNSSVSFISNKAPNNAGGAILAQGSLYIFENSKAQFFANAIEGDAGGGAIFGVQSSSVNFIASSVSFTSNTAQVAGGALGVTNYSYFTFANSTVTFAHNFASVYGGAVYLRASTLAFINSQINFSNNAMGEISNDIYMEDERSAVIFDGQNIFTNGLKSTGAVNAVLEKTGDGILSFEKTSSLLNTFIISGGAVQFKSNISSVSNLNVGVNAMLTMKNDSAADEIFILGDFVLGGQWEIDVNFPNSKSDKLQIAGSANFLSGARLLINPLGSTSGQEDPIEILTAVGEITNYEDLVPLDESYSVSYEFKSNSLVLTHNGNWNAFVAQFRTAKDYAIVTPKSAVLNAAEDVYPSAFRRPVGNFLTIDGLGKTLDASNPNTQNLGFIFGNSLDGQQVSSSATFKNITFSKFSQADVDMGVVFFIERSTLVFMDAINFNQNAGMSVLSAKDASIISFRDAKAAFSQNKALSVFSLNASALEVENSNLNFTDNNIDQDFYNISATAASSIAFINSTISFTNAKSPNFISSIYLNDNSQMYFYNSQITFKNDTGGGIALNDANSTLNLMGGIVFANGLKSSGAGAIISQGENVFEGGISNIQNSFAINSGAVYFKVSSSTIKNLTIADAAKLSLINSNAQNRIYVETLDLEGTLELDVNLNEADRIVASEGITLGTQNNFSLNFLSGEKFIVILAQGASIAGTLNTAPAGSHYFLFQTADGTGGNIFARYIENPDPDDPQPDVPDQAKVSEWNDFITMYQNAIFVAGDEILLLKNLSAETEELDRPIGATNAQTPFIINGGGFSLNVQNLKNYYFDLGAAKNITFKNIGFLNFNTDTQSRMRADEDLTGAVIDAKEGSLITFTGNINFKNNFSNGKPNDITLQNEDSAIIFDGAVTLVNGIRSDGLGKVQSNGSVVFGGDKTVIENNFEVLAGQLNFKSAVSSVNFLNFAQGTTLSLQDDKAGTKLYAGEITMRSNLMSDIDFKTFAADQIFASSITIFSGYRLTIKDSHPEDLTVNEIPIMIASSSQAFTILGGEAFEYDRSLYVLRFDQKDGKLFIKNIKPEMEGGGDGSPNREDVEEIANRDGRLKYPLSRLSLDKRRKALDSLSGVFMTNIFVAQTQVNSEFLFNQIRQEASLSKVWGDINYSVTQFSKHGQTLGTFEMSGVGIDLGSDFFGTRIGAVIARVGVYANANVKSFKQDENTAGLTDLGLGIYENTNVGNFNLQFLAGMRYANANTSRIIEMDTAYNPVAEFSITGIESALKMDYGFDIGKGMKAGPFVLVEASQNNVREIAEHGGLVTDLTFMEADWMKAQGMFGGEIKSDKDFINVFLRGYAGMMLVKDPSFYVDFTSIENSTMYIQSDRVDEIFYGGAVGINARLNNDVSVGAMGYGRFSHSFANYGGQISVTYILKGSVPRLPFLESRVGLRELTLKDRQAIKYFVKKLTHSNKKYKGLTVKIYLNVSEDEEAMQLDKAKVEWAQMVFDEMMKNGLQAARVQIIKYRVKPMTKAINLRVEMNE